MLNIRCFPSSSPPHATRPRQRRAIRHALVLAALAPFGCSEASRTPELERSSDDAGGPDTVSIEEACRLAVEVSQRQVARCGESLGSRLVLETQYESCRDFLSLPGLTAKPSAYAECMKRADAAPCESPPTACEFGPGTLEEGAGCVTRFQCATGHCAAFGNKCGVCAVANADGDACVRGLDCAEGSTCVSGRCTPRVALGGSCGLDGGGGGGPECQRGLHCSAGRCVARRGLGAACEEDFGCITGVCLAGRCENVRKTGESCAGDLGSHCDFGDTCKDGVCAPFSTRKPGEACNQDQECLFSYCNEYPDGERCAPILEEGAACTTGRGSAVCKPLTDCVDGFCRSLYTRVCPGR